MVETIYKCDKFSKEIDAWPVMGIGDWVGDRALIIIAHSSFMLLKFIKIFFFISISHNRF